METQTDDIGRTDAVTDPHPPAGSWTVLTLAHNEAGIIEEVVRDIHRQILSRLAGGRLLVVEDGSSDGTREILERLRGGMDFSLLTEPGKQGYTSALRRGLSDAAARSDFIFFTDSDGQHDQADFWKLQEMIGEADMVIGVKEHRQDSWFRNTISRVMNRILVPALFGVRLRDINCGFRVMRREVAAYLLGQEWLFRDCVFAELTLRARRAGFRVAETPVSHTIRRFGTSSGLPSRKMPGILLRIVKNFLALRREFSRSGSPAGAA